MRKVAAAIAVLFAGLCLLVVYMHYQSIPPRESVFIANFAAHRPAYEQLRLLLRRDDQLIRIGTWGVATNTSPLPQIPSQ